jgi:hypothetical protein
MRKTFTLHTDNGHGWLRVTIAEITMLRFHINDFSRYSYRKNDDLFLEEDCDAGKFLNAFQAMYGEPHINVENYNGSSPIRRYRRIKEEA